MLPPVSPNPLSLTGVPGGPGQATSPDTRLREAARNLEATFIAEMLRASGAERQAGLGDDDSPFGSFLLDARAKEIARAGGLGLAEVLFESLARRDGTS
jgi:peptidoglycan hydrolase FlgJ